MSGNNILVIEDEKEIAELIEAFLINEGYGVYKAFNGSEGLAMLEEQQIHLIILDIMLPGLDGLEVCRRVRKLSNIPIIMLSAKSQDRDKILGLGTGADDYMVKPFNPMELIARVKSQLRRYTTLNKSITEKNNTSILEVKGLTINKENHAVSLYDKEINLTPTEYEILLLLAGNTGRVFSSEEIFQRVWQEKYYESNNTVMVHMWRLREKIEVNPKEPKVIETVWGVGYKIEK
jgi:two-component system, OmpR family, response regulator VanR